MALHVHRYMERSKKSPIIHIHSQLFFSKDFKSASEKVVSRKHCRSTKCSFVCGDACMCMCSCVCACGHQRWMSKAFFNHSPTLFLKQGPTWILKLTDLVRLLDNEAQGSSHFSTLHPQCRRHWHTLLCVPLYMGAGILTLRQQKL